MDNAQVTQKDGLTEVRDADHALLLMDEVDSLVRFCSVSMLDVDRYARGSWAFWSVCHWIARHRLERSEPVGWMGIESAPKDGTRIDLWIGGEYPARYPDAYWGRPHHTCGEAGRYCDCCPSYDGWVDGTLNCYLTGDEGVEDEPTHWMPIPSAPVKAGDGCPCTVCSEARAPLYTTPPEPVAEIERLRDELNKARGILERLRDFDGWQGTFHAGHAYDAKQEAIAYLKGAS